MVKIPPYSALCTPNARSSLQDWPWNQSWTQTPRHGLSHWMTRKTAGPDKSALDTAPAPLRAARGRREGHRWRPRLYARQAREV
jgi:hypothetical protein